MSIINKLLEIEGGKPLEIGEGKAMCGFCNRIYEFDERDKHTKNFIDIDRIYKMGANYSYSGLFWVCPNCESEVRRGDFYIEKGEVKNEYYK